jgi:peptidoglycan hydrolase CwlO-like protein
MSLVMKPQPRLGARARTPAAAARALTLVGLALASVVGGALLGHGASASADQVSNLRAQASQIAKDLVLEQLQIDSFQQQYAVDGAKVQQDQAQIQAREQQIQVDARRVRDDRSRLQSEAIFAYIHQDPALNGAQLLFEGNQTQAVLRSEYEAVTSGDMNLAIDALHSDESGLRAQQAALGQQEALDQATTDQQATLAGEARQTETTFEAEQAQVTGQLAAAVAQQQAAQAVAAARAVRAAQAAAVAAATPSPPAPATSRTPAPAAPSAASPTTSAGPGVAGPPAAAPALPPFLRCVLQAESGGDYGAVSPGGTYMGGFQFSQATWNAAALLAGLPQLANVPPNQATPAQQDDLAIALYQADGQQPWNDSCRTA